jgi:hypothetical protein
VKDFSKGVRKFNSCHLYGKNERITVHLTIWLSIMELLCADVSHPVEASIAINISTGHVVLQD